MQDPMRKSSENKKSIESIDSLRPTCKARANGRGKGAHVGRSKVGVGAPLQNRHGVEAPIWRKVGEAHHRLVHRMIEVLVNELGRRLLVRKHGVPVLPGPPLLVTAAVPVATVIAIVLVVGDPSPPAVLGWPPLLMPGNRKKRQTRRSRVAVGHGRSWVRPRGGHGSGVRSPRPFLPCSLLHL